MQDFRPLLPRLTAWFFVVILLQITPTAPAQPPAQPPAQNDAVPLQDSSPYTYHYSSGFSNDCDRSLIPDECEWDCNNNRILDRCDISSGFSTDFNNNLVPDECDITGDVNGNGSVNVSDLLQILSQWGACPDCPADINGDGTVNVTDLLIVLANWTG